MAPRVNASRRRVKRPRREAPATDTHSRLQAVVSPDRKWVAYSSDESGPQEVYVRAFPNGTRRWLVSRDGGVRPRWSCDGKRLFFLNREGLLEVDVSNGPGPNLTPHLRQAWGEWIDLLVAENPELGERPLGLRNVDRYGERASTLCSTCSVS